MSEPRGKSGGSGPALDNNGNTTSSAGIPNTYDFENRLLTRGAVLILYDGDGAGGPP